MKRAAVVAFCLGATFVSARAEAAGFYIGDLGAKGMARGGAFVADPDSLLALHYNPAGLAGQRGLLLEADLTLLSQSFAFARSCPCVYPDRIMGAMPSQDPAALDARLQERFSARPVEGQAGVRPIPFLGIGFGFPILDLTIAAGAYGPHGGAYDYGARDYTDAVTQPQRYSLIAADSIEANYQLGAAFSPLDGLKIGASLILYQTKSTQFLHIYANTLLTPFAENESTVIDPDGALFDIPIELQFERALALNWSVGASYEIIPGLTLGGSFRGPRAVSAAGNLRADLPPILTDAGISIVDGGGPVNVRFSMPAIGRLGAQFRIPSLFAAEVATVWEGWSAHDKVEIAADAVQLEVFGQPPESLGTLVLERQWRNTISLRLAGELLLFDPLLGVTAGYYYEPSAIPDERLQPSTIDSAKHGLSLGLRTSFFGVTAQLAISHVRLVGRTIANSAVEVPAPLDTRNEADPEAFGTDTYVTRIGNGAYSGSYTIATLGLSYTFDPL